jgi:hypothetical protein
LLGEFLCHEPRDGVGHAAGRKGATHHRRYVIRFGLGSREQ